MACGRLASSRWREAGDAAGLEGDLSPQRFGRKEWRMAALLVGGGLATGPNRSLSRLRRLAPAASRQRPDSAIESRALAHRTIFSTRQGRFGFGPLRRPKLARFSPPSNYVGDRLPVCG